MPPTPRHHGFSPSHPHLHSALSYLLSPSRVIAIHPSPLLILLIFRPPSAPSILAPRIPPSSPDPPPHHPFPDSRDRPLSRLPVSTPLLSRAALAAAARCLALPGERESAMTRALDHDKGTGSGPRQGAGRRLIAKGAARGEKGNQPRSTLMAANA